MRMDLPLCNLKSCRNNFDCNCKSERDFFRCEYTFIKCELDRLSDEAKIQADAKAINVPTIGDKIRESNESLAAYASEFFDCDCCKIINPTCMYKYSECEKLMLEYFKKPAESEEE